MGKFKIGDKVVVTAHNNDIEYPAVFCSKDIFNLPGTICRVHCTDWVDGSTSYGIRFEINIDGHDCDGTCKYGYGQNINEKYLKLYDEKLLQIWNEKYLKLYDEKPLQIWNKDETIITFNTIKEREPMQKEKHEKKSLEQQIKEKYESKRNVLNTKTGFTKEMSLVPKKFYYDTKTYTDVIDFGCCVGKIKTKPVEGDMYDPDIALNVLAAKAIYKRFNFPLEPDMSSLEAKITAKYLLHKNTGIAFDKYVKYLNNMVQTFLQENAELEMAEQIRKNQKAKNRIRKERQKQRR